MILHAQGNVRRYTIKKGRHCIAGKPDGNTPICMVLHSKEMIERTGRLRQRQRRLRKDHNDHIRRWAAHPLGA